MTNLTPFSPDYKTARKRFRQAVEQAGWQRETHSIERTGPDCEDLAIDVAWSPAANPDRTLVVSSGVHGVEGFFGSAVQLALLDLWSRTEPPPVRCVFLHALNPWGFAWLRRFDENNVDPNRNFLLEHEQYAGSPPGYAELNGLLNPTSPPSRWNAFFPKALLAMARHGSARVRQSVAAGQYEFPKGLFYGGSEPSQMHRILDEHLPRWLEGSRSVVHLDFHTGLGRSGTYKLLIDYPLISTEREKFTRWFGADSFEACESEGISYDARGGLGRWCVARDLAPEYLFACAEFGTYGPVRIVAGLRAENQAHHWGEPGSAGTIRAKQHLKELFCPAADSWRSTVLRHSVNLVNNAIAGLADESGLL